MWLYETSEDNSERYILGNVSGPQPMICIGVNPSTAEPFKLDPTMRRIDGFATKLNWQGWIMLNLYPQRTPDPDRLHHKLLPAAHIRNLNEIRLLLRIFQEAPLFCCWGNSIEKRPWLRRCCNDILEQNGRGRACYSFGKPSQKGHPKHPLFLNSRTIGNLFNVFTYQDEVLKCTK
jgi:hypothetical protein